MLLINAFSQQQGRDQRDKSFELLSNYVYFQCAPKIWSRLQLRVDHGRDKFHELLASVAVDEIGRTPTLWDPSVVPDYVHRHDESWLLKAISTWTLIEAVTLTNISFPSSPPGDQNSLVRYNPLLPSLPRLRRLYLGQVTFLSPTAIAAMALQDATILTEQFDPKLEQIRLVDAYEESIWGNDVMKGV